MSGPQYIMQRDSSNWRVQVWISFATALLASATGVLLLPGQELDRAFLAIGFVFCLFACFSVAKTVRDNRDGQVDTGSWIMTVWIAFGAAVCLTAWGLWRMVIDDWQKAYMIVSWLFLISSSFTVAKTVRDKLEADLMDRSSSSHEAPPAPTVRTP